MVDTTFVSKTTTVLAAWLQAINDRIYRGKSPLFVTSTGAADAQVVTLPATSLYAAGADGDEFTFKAGFANTGAATLSVVGSATIGPFAIQQYGAALVANAIILDSIVTVVLQGSIWHVKSVTKLTAANARTALGAATLANAVMDGDAASGDLTGTYPGPTVAADAITEAKTAFRRAFVRRTTNITTTTNTLLLVPWGTAVYDNGALVDLGAQATRITIPSSYTLARFWWGLTWTGNTTGTRHGVVQKNGALLEGDSRLNISGVTQSTYMSSSTPWLIVTAGDYFELGALQDSGGNLDVIQGVSTYFAAEIMK
jgi:hypothetical protein